MTFDEILVLQYAITHLTEHKKREIIFFSFHPLYGLLLKQKFQT